MMRKIFLITLAVVVIIIVTVSPAYAGTFFDDFNDGNADGWWLGYSLARPSVYGNWRVENGELVQNQAGDGFIALVENYQISDQTVETDLKLNGPAGYGGIMLWFQDDDNWVNIRVYPAVKRVYVGEYIDRVPTYVYYSTELRNNTWHKLKVEANSSNGNIQVYIDDVYLLTYIATTPNRIGQTGVFNGNSGGSSGGKFDNFSIIADSILTDKDQCKGDGWKMFSNPTFKSQGECVSYLESNENAGKGD